MADVVVALEQPSRIKKGLQNDASVAFLAGGLAGAVSRTVVSPFERVKILLQVQSSSESYSGGVSSAVKQLYKEEGVKGLFRGNGLNCIRVFPYSAVQFLVYEGSKNFIFHVDGVNGNGRLTTFQRLFSGALCGGASVMATYPLDLVRTRLAIQTANLRKLQKAKATSMAKPPGVWQLLRNTYLQEGGIKGLYRGVWPTSLGVVPYVALNFCVYEQLRELVPSQSAYMLAIGALSGGIAQTATYPFDLLRRRFQVLAMGQSELGFHYSGVADALITIGKTEGLRGYYRGLQANLFKVIPSTAVSWLVYELTRDFIKAL
ncbi:hypothetical protein ZYGR_0P01090 [Zygosaccharomyces rouxii]|uniref:ZYRO0E02728p n=2 Tax=Zygosaccharomyces rouxii TaxID=4956 RepID=C5E446_ZYGRC|nr:uncharacterized protein ZYRO0E02728g [Zygosaccharomyces rouxii]KAH9198333.1 mitochondrial carrier domain-containing protein [Zygosaccharomyces rouxii]GAV49465.1 hypothetical protein ZYGR_0P01090 [Zygosaccharomyces rouxii]CAR30807.1 ZYRO0E02728p [Zygosaccharomyces rouxii]